MEGGEEFDEESLQAAEALLNRHSPQMIARMVAMLDSRRNSVASSRMSSNASLRSRLSVASIFSTSTSYSSSTGSSNFAPSIASSTSRSRNRRPEPRSYPAHLDHSGHKSARLTPSSESGSPLDLKVEHGFAPKAEDVASISSPVAFHGDKSQLQSPESFMFCTYCAESNVQKTFKAKSDWKKHEMRMHETGEDWPCPVPGCGQVHDRQKDFIKHHSRYHSGRPIPSVSDIGIRLLPRKVFGCGFERCKEVSIGWDERCDHVAKHMKNGATLEQWSYSNVIRNLIRQEALHDTWKTIFASLSERLREGRSHITWSPENTRVLRQKLQCCDLRPSREDVLITALSLRSDLPLEPSEIQIPPGFTTPSRDSVPHGEHVSREQRMEILNGNSNYSQSQARLQTINLIMHQRSLAEPNFVNYAPSPVVSIPEKRISYMDVDPTEYFNPPPQSLPPPPTPMPALQPPSLNGELPPGSTYAEPSKQTNPLSYFHYFDAAPNFEESNYSNRPVQASLGQLIAKPLHGIGSRLGSRNESPHSRPSSLAGFPDSGSGWPGPHQQQQPDLNAPQSPALSYMPQQAQQHQFTQQLPPSPPPRVEPFPYAPRQQQQPQQQPQQQQFRGPTSQTPLHHFTPHC